MKRRLTLITEIIAPYRVPVFNALAAREDIELHVIFLSHTDTSLREWNVPLDEIRFSYEVLPSFRRRIGKYNLLVNRGLKKALERSRPDVVLCGGYSYVAAWQAGLWARKRRIPFLLWIESTAFDQRKRRALVEGLKRKFFSLCSGFVVPGQSSAAYLREFDVPDTKIFHAPNAVDNVHFSEGAKVARGDAAHVRTRLELPDRYFLYVGRLVEAKGVFELLDAYAKLEESLRSIIGLVFVGDGRARLQLESRAATIVPGKIRFAGFVQKEQLPAYYALCDALMFPTHSDTWGLVVNEAMASGTAIVTTDVAGCVADLVENGRNGFVVASESVTPLADVMQKLASRDELRRQMGLRSIDRIKGYSPDACAAGIARAAGVACQERP